jgi:DNA polymerase III delta prime subunit
MDAIHDIAFERNSINDLVLDPEENKSLLKALAKRYAQKPADIDVLPPVIKDGVTVVGNSPDGPYAADFVEGKGEGQIILLHGPPGVGKTCTAGKRCIKSIVKERP